MCHLPKNYSFRFLLEIQLGGCAQHREYKRSVLILFRARSRDDKKKHKMSLDLFPFVFPDPRRLFLPHASSFPSFLFFLVDHFLSLSFSFPPLSFSFSLPLPLPASLSFLSLSRDLLLPLFPSLSKLSVPVSPRRTKEGEIRR